MTTLLHADRLIVRELLATYAEAASLPIHQEKADRWRRLNRLDAGRPLVWINQIPWEEMNVDDELTCRCVDPYLRGVEGHLRRELYQWRHMPGDMVLDPVFYVDLVCSPTNVYADYGIQEQLHTAEGHHSVGFIPIMQSEEDIAKIRMPEVTVDWEKTERRVALVSEIAAGTLPVEVRGITHQWFSPWDLMIHWYGIEQLYMDMVDRPEVVHALLRHFMAISHAVLDTQEAMSLLAPGGGNHQVGSGGLGISDELPRADYAGGPASPKDQWGTSTGQIFSEVSPDMHEEFSLQYERPYLERFGVSCYGCCEPLHNKMHLMRTVSNLRRISMSYWIDLDIAAEQVGADYVFSYKPTPSIFAWDNWDIEAGRANLQQVLEKTRGCRVELIMKDISTVRHQPQRLWEWAAMAMEMVEAYA